MSKPVVIIDIAAAIRQIGEDDFYSDVPQSAGQIYFAPNSLALRHWVEGWERAQIDAWCDEQAMKDTWAVEQFKKALDL
jgi:hypothetical protein